jgi:hypothetical protein
MTERTEASRQKVRCIECGEGWATSVADDVCDRCRARAATPAQRPPTETPKMRSAIDDAFFYPPQPAPLRDGLEPARDALVAQLCNLGTIFDALVDDPPDDLDVVQARCRQARDAFREAAAALAQRDDDARDSRRLHWLHSQASCVLDAEGYEWGIWRVKWEHGQAVSVRATLSDFSDLDAAMNAPETRHVLL